MRAYVRHKSPQQILQLELNSGFGGINRQDFWFMNAQNLQIGATCMRLQHDQMKKEKKSIWDKEMKNHISEVPKFSDIVKNKESYLK